MLVGGEEIFRFVVFVDRFVFVGSRFMNFMVVCEMFNVLRLIDYYSIFLMKLDWEFGGSLGIKGILCVWVYNYFKNWVYLCVR